MTDSALVLIGAVRRRLTACPELAAHRARLASWESRNWASATYLGARTRFTCVIDGAADGPGLKALIAALHDSDMPLPGHVLIDMQFVESTSHDGPDDSPDRASCCTLAMFEALVIEDPQRDQPSTHGATILSKVVDRV